MLVPTARLRLPVSVGSLDADWYAGTGKPGGAVVAPPHPEYGGERGHWVVQAIVRTLADAGHAVVAFDWRGVGASEGRTTGDGAAALEDFSAAATALTTRAPGPWIAAGYSFGAATALRVAANDPTVAGLLLVAPPVAMTGTGDLASCAKPLGVVVGDGDTIAPAALLRRELAARPTARLEILTGVDHFFGGSDPARLVAALASVLPTVG